MSISDIPNCSKSSLTARKRIFFSFFSRKTLKKTWFLTFKAYISLVFQWISMKLSAILDKRCIKKLQALKIGEKKYSVAQNGGSRQHKKKLLAGGQTALAAVQYVRSNLWIRQNVRENCTVLLVPCLVPYDHFWGRYSNSKKVDKRSLKSGRTLYI